MGNHCEVPTIALVKVTNNDGIITTEYKQYGLGLLKLNGAPIVGNLSLNFDPGYNFTFFDNVFSGMTLVKWEKINETN